MSRRELLYAGLMLFGVMISSLSQILLKTAANRTYASRIREYLNPLVITAYAVFFGATLCTVWAYRVIPLSMGPILESSSYVFVSIFGYLFFREKMTKKKLIGLAAIVCGITIYSVS